MVRAASAFNALMFVPHKVVLSCFEVGWLKLGVMVGFFPRFSFTEWELMEWSEQQAVFNFLYDSVTLTVVFGPPAGESQNG